MLKLLAIAALIGTGAPRPDPLPVCRAAFSYTPLCYGANAEAAREIAEQIGLDQRIASRENIRALVRESNCQIVGPPKSKSQYRFIPIYRAHLPTARGWTDVLVGQLITKGDYFVSIDKRYLAGDCRLINAKAATDAADEIASKTAD